jgi:hypothetical protein
LRLGTNDFSTLLPYPAASSNCGSLILIIPDQKNFDPHTSHFEGSESLASGQSEQRTTASFMRVLQQLWTSFSVHFAATAQQTISN